MSRTMHLMKRRGIWYYKRRVPERLVPVLGRTFVRRSLKTADRATAIKLRALEDVKTDALFDEAEKLLATLIAQGAKAAPPVPMEVLEEQVRKYVVSKDAQFAEWLAANPPKDAQELQERRQDTGLDLTLFKQAHVPGHDDAVAQATDALLKAAEAEIADPETLARVAEIARRGQVERFNRELDRLDHRLDRPFHDILFDPNRKPAITFATVAQTFLDERRKEYALNGVAEKRIDQITARVAYFREVIGDTTPVQDIDDDAIQRVRDLLARTPTNKGKHYPTLTTLEAIERAKKDGRPVLSPTTQSAYLDVLRDILKVAVRKRHVGHNAAQDVKPLARDTRSNEEKRLVWSMDQIVGFFTGKFYRSCAPTAEVPYKKPDRDWRFWLPLIMLLSGARPNEICQLEVKDIRRTEAGTWFMDLRNEDGSKSVKTKTSRRRVPLHPELLKMGFLAFVDQRRKAPELGARLFYRLKPKKGGNLATYPSTRLRDHFIPQEITLGPRQVPYSLRHNFRDALRRIKAPPDALRNIGGWSQGKTVSDQYGDPGNPDFYAEYVAGIEYPGLDLSFLYVAQEAKAQTENAKLASSPSGENSDAQI